MVSVVGCLKPGFSNKSIRKNNDDQTPHRLGKYVKTKTSLGFHFTCPKTEDPNLPKTQPKTFQRHLPTTQHFPPKNNLNITQTSPKHLKKKTKRNKTPPPTSPSHRFAELQSLSVLSSRAPPSQPPGSQLPRPRRGTENSSTNLGHSPRGGSNKRRLKKAWVIKQKHAQKTRRCVARKHFYRVRM